jgi:hypothetical protein
MWQNVNVTWERVLSFAKWTHKGMMNEPVCDMVPLVSWTLFCRLYLLLSEQNHFLSNNLCKPDPLFTTTEGQ